jgi:hypothetical protein
MKFVKYLAVLTVVLCAFASNSHAQTIQVLGGGSSALFQELGQAAATSAAINTPCVWTQGSSANVLARDNRTIAALGAPTDEKGNIWITWSAGAGTCAAPAAPGFNIYSYMSLDSVVGDKCYFETELSGAQGCVQILTVAVGTPGAGLLTGITDLATGIPLAVINALNNQRFFVAGTDVRPEDGKFATFRALTPCGQAVYRQAFDQGLRQTYGLGYQTANAGIGLQVKSAFSAKLFNVLDFNVTGNDPITGKAVPNYSVSTVGAQPIVVLVAGSANGMQKVNDVNGFVLTNFYQGVLGRTSDFFGPTVVNPVTVLVREPLSGTYNTFEFSIPNSSQFHGSQDDNFCNGNQVFNQIMNIQGTNGTALSFRKRVIGTGEMTSTMQTLGAAGTEALGYVFYSSGNVAGLPNVRYVTVNGVDPIQPTYTTGAFPAAANFQNVNQGDYAVWSALRLVSTSPAPAGVTNLIAAVQTVPLTANDMIPLANLKIWHSHYYLPAINIGVAANGTTVNVPNDLCATAGAIVESGGDAGGANVPINSNHQFCQAFNNITGLINKAN